MNLRGFAAAGNTGKREKQVNAPMDETPPTLLLTRPKPQSEAFLVACEAMLDRRLSAVISPLLRIEPMGDVPDLTAFDTIIVTSGNGVERLKDHLAGRYVVTVGEKTAALAREHGAEAVALGENIAAFLGNADQIRGGALLCRGVHSRGDIVQSLTDRGIKAEEVILYDQVGQALSAAALQLLSGDAHVIAPVFSPRSAKLLSAYTFTAPLSVLAISDATKDAWEGTGEVRVAVRPDAESMLHLVRTVA